MSRLSHSVKCHSMTRLYHGVTKSLNVHNQGINSLFFLVCYTSVNQTDIIHVQACEGCKGFFRRSINQKPVYKPCKAKYLTKFYSFYIVPPFSVRQQVQHQLDQQEEVPRMPSSQVLRKGEGRPSL